MSEVTCSACGQTANVPFVPTPGRPVYCRNCFSKRQPAGPSAGPARRPAPSFRGGPPGRRGPAVPGQRKRMLSMGRKGHFMYDAREVLTRTEGGMEDQHHRAFLEGLFARGSRTDVDAAQEFLDEKLAEGTITPEEREGLGRLVERYSFMR